MLKHTHIHTHLYKCSAQYIETRNPSNKRNIRYKIRISLLTKLGLEYITLFIMKSLYILFVGNSIYIEKVVM